MKIDDIKNDFIDKLLSIKKAIEGQNEKDTLSSAEPINNAVDDVRIFINVNREMGRKFT